MKNCFNKRYVVDLDNTLVFTEYLNNLSYINALKLKNIFIDVEKIDFRITRKYIIENFGFLTKREIKKIIKLKQKYFIKNLDKTTLNDNLFNIVKQSNKNNCIIWTSASNIRVKEIMKYYDLSKYFKKVILSNKTDLDKDIIKICNVLKCKPKEMIVMEDDINIIKKLEKKNIRVIKI